ncbi:MarR family winged helix-turn-helix transcriptional regulator [Mycolicibacterium litorale]|uniref:MarR family transcriptional regulator n=1 Tax=Mycolicibacterium litorale TaxID=758802 RepID=A0AAD1MSQ2_9MYCO|nr:MarR family transcriptional regulator [Mycolicibacterium litorale]MCV7416202.1 MarR family transcriptional regulator [Mycolicibacterium litorale]TDY09453.1 DNA-binding MarR family transcriptional regulator [Mycolicibacterium litorale]BBY17399.1 MarR family transcriptional regulator [Mycolicibacterium litorale]
MAEPAGWQAMRSVLLLCRSMTAVVDQDLKDGFGLRLIDFHILKQLQSTETGTCLLGEVARELFVHATTVSIATERLSHRNLVSRRAHPTDRRATLVGITDEGRELAEAATVALAAAEFGLAGLTPDQLAALSGVHTARTVKD